MPDFTGFLEKRRNLMKKLKNIFRGTASDVYILIPEDNDLQYLVKTIDKLLFGGVKC